MQKLIGRGVSVEHCQHGSGNIKLVSSKDDLPAIGIEHEVIAFFGSHFANNATDLAEVTLDDLLALLR